MNKPHVYQINGEWYYEMDNHILAVEKTKSLAIQNGRARAKLKRNGVGAWPGEKWVKGWMKKAAK